MLEIIKNPLEMQNLNYLKLQLQKFYNQIKF